MLKNMRRKLANAISPDKATEYEVKAIRWATAEQERKRAIASNYELFKEHHGREAKDDEEAITYVRQWADNLERERGLKQ